MDTSLLGIFTFFLYIWKDDLTTLYYYRTEPEVGVEQKTKRRLILASHGGGKKPAFRKLFLRI